MVRIHKIANERPGSKFMMQGSERLLTLAGIGSKKGEPVYVAYSLIGETVYVPVDSLVEYSAKVIPLNRKVMADKKAE